MNETLYYLLRAKSTHCGQMSDRSVPNFRRKSQKKIEETTPVHHYTLAVATLRCAVAGDVNKLRLLTILLC